MVPSGVCGFVFRAGRERGLYLHKLHTTRLRTGHMKPLCPSLCAPPPAVTMVLLHTTSNLFHNRLLPTVHHCILSFPWHFCFFFFFLAAQSTATNLILLNFPRLDGQNGNRDVCKNPQRFLELLNQKKSDIILRNILFFFKNQIIMDFFLSLVNIIYPCNN